MWVYGLCAALAASAAAAFEPEQTPAAHPAAQPSKVEAPLPADIAKLPFEVRDGYSRFIKRCTACHDTKRVEAAQKTLFDWQGTIATMALKKGANIPADDRQPIFLYLAYLNGTKGTPEQKDQYLTFLFKCEDCHGVGLVYKDKKPMKDWPSIIHRMAGKGRARITPEDEKKVLGYINRMYPEVFGVE
jgi:cytochrome c5